MDFTGGSLLMLIGPTMAPVSFRNLETVLPRIKKKNQHQKFQKMSKKT